MRVAGLVDCFGYERKNLPFMPVNRCSYFIVRPTPHALLALKHRISADKEGIKIGATEWPEEAQTIRDIDDESQRNTILDSVMPVKHANYIFRHVVDNKEEIEVFPDVQSQRWVGSNGKTYKKKDIRYKFFSRNITKVCNDLLEEDPDADISHIASVDYYNWCIGVCSDDNDQFLGVKPNKKVIDVDTPAGGDMCWAVRNVYHGATALTDRIPVPPLFYQTKENLKIDKEQVLRQLLTASGNNTRNKLSAESPNRFCILLKSERSNGILKLFLGLLRQNKQTGKQTLTDEVECLEIPDEKSVIKVLRPDLGEKYKPLDAVPDEDVITPFAQFLKIINKRCWDFDQVKEQLGESLFNWCCGELEANAAFRYKNSNMYPLRFIAELPEVVDPNKFMVRNKRFEFAADVPAEASSFIWNDNFLAVDLLHHAWYHPSELGSSNHRSWPTRPHASNKQKHLQSALSESDLKGGIE